MLSPELVAEAFAKHHSIRGAAGELGFDERTLRRWAKEDPRIARVLYSEDQPREQMRLLCLDIETRPNIALVWDLWQKNVPPQAVTEATSMLCWAAKWLDEPEMSFKSVYHDTQASMVRDMWELLGEADAVIHYNGSKFDIPYINMEFVRAGLGPPAPYKEIDLYRAVKKRFGFPSKKLVYVAREFGLEGKIEHEGFPLWIKCMNNDADAWARMRSYNIRDTELLQALYYKLRPWATSLPSYGAMSSGDVCPACGSSALLRKGFDTTRTGRYQRYVCRDCGKWSRATKRASGTGVTEIA